MRKALLITATCAGAILSGCSVQPIRTFESPTIVNLKHEINSGDFTQKTNVFYSIMDTSSSMTEGYKGTEYRGDSTATKFAVGKELLLRINKSIADLPFNAVALRNFGSAPCISLSGTDPIYQSKHYSASALADSLGKTECSSGGSPLAKSLTATNTDLSSTSGNIALLIISDGLHFNTSPVPAVNTLKSKFGNRLCVYSIWVGNRKDIAGQAALAELSSHAGCGFAVTADAIGSERHFDEFTKQVFLAPAQPAPIIPPEPIDGDDDQDGVPNSRDKCPNTPKGAKVDKDGCWVIEGVHFDFDKSDIKPVYYPILDEVVEVIQRNPGLTIEIQGHTDNYGTPEYNLPLSKRRAQAVQQYISNKVGNKADLSATGFGLTKPIESNQTAAGRAKNRRSQLLVIE